MPRMLAFIIVLLIVGLIAGALARLLVPGRDPIGLLGTIVLGVLGSFLGGFILNLIEYHTSPSTTSVPPGSSAPLSAP